MHYCIGAPLGSAEIGVAVRALLDRYATITVGDDPPGYVQLLILRGLASLPVTLERPGS